MEGSNYNKEIMVGEHLIKMPPLPSDKRQILFVDEKDAHWRRDLLLSLYRQIWWHFIPYHTQLYKDATLYDQDQILVSLNKEDSDYIVRTYEEEMRRRNEGVFVKIRNEIVWLPGDYWFVLMYCKTKRADKKGDYFDFRRFQLEDAYLVSHADNSPHIWGLDTSKPKKTGITNIRWLYILNRATKTKNANYGNMNIDQDKGAKTFRDHFMYAYNGLPMVWKAQIKSKSDTDGKVIFGRRYNNSKRSLLLMNEAEDELNTTVMCVPTMPHAFDVDVFDINWYDEPPKYKTDFGEIYRSNSSGTSIQDFVVGKQWFTSYTPEENSPSFLAAKELFFDSKLSTIKGGSNGQTKSKLICHHIPSYASWWGAFDKYGDCNEAEAIKRIDFGRNQLKDRPKELQAETRKYAKTEREAWSTGGMGSIFDPARLSELLFDVEEEQRNSVKTPYLEGRLEWRNKLWEIGLKNKRPKGEFCPVDFVLLTDSELASSTKGRLRIYNEVPRHIQNAILKNGKDEWGCLIPPTLFPYTFGADPTQHAAASEVISGSKNGYAFLSRADERLDAIYGNIASKRFDLIYFDRPELPHEAYEDLVKMIIYTGGIGIVEANVPTMATNLIEEGLGGFMLVREEKGSITQWKRHMGLAHEPDKKYHLIRTTANSPDTRTMLELFVSLWKAYITKPEDGGKDYGPTFKDERGIKQLMDIDVTNTKLFDLFMCTGYAFVADEMYSAMLLRGDNNGSGIGEIASVLSALAS